METPALTSLLARANQGDPGAQCDLGYYFHLSAGTAPDQSTEDHLHKLALSWFRLAAKQDYPPSFNALGYLHSLGIGCEKNDSVARQFYTFAANSDYLPSINNLAFCLSYGLGGPLEQSQGLALFKKAAELGNPAACYNYAMCLEYGIGLPGSDPRNAITWYKKAVEAGETEAEKRIEILGILYPQFAVKSQGQVGWDPETGRPIQISRSRTESHQDSNISSPESVNAPVLPTSNRSSRASNPGSFSASRENSFSESQPRSFENSVASPLMTGSLRTAKEFLSVPNPASAGLARNFSTSALQPPPLPGNRPRPTSPLPPTPPKPLPRP